MSENKKKLFPKLKKKLKGFITDESGKITKKDALGLSVGAILLSGIDDVSAGSSYTHSITPSADFYPSNSDAYQPANHTNSVSNQFVIMDGATCSHSSGIVNGHYSSIPSVNTSYATYNATTTHSSHSSSGSGSGSGSGSW